MGRGLFTSAKSISPFPRIIRGQIWRALFWPEERAAACIRRRLLYLNNSFRFMINRWFSTPYPCWCWRGLGTFLSFHSGGLTPLQKLFGDGAQYGLRLSYVEQPRPEGLAQAFILGEGFIGQDSVCLILGDNIFYGRDLKHLVQQAASQKQDLLYLLITLNTPKRTEWWKSILTAKPYL